MSIYGWVALHGALLLMLIGLFVMLVRKNRRASKLQDAPVQIELLCHGNRFSEARDLARKLLVQMIREEGEGSFGLVPNLQKLAWIHSQIGEYADAYGLYEKAKLLLEAQRGSDHLEVGQALLYMADELVNLGRFDEAELLLRRAVRIFEEQQGPRSENLFNCHRSLAAILENRGDLYGAIAAQRKALSLVAVVHDRSSPWQALVLIDLAGLHSRMGEPKLSLPLFDDSRVLLAQFEEVPLETWIRFHALRGEVLAQLDRYSEAKQELEFAWTLVEGKTEDHLFSWRMNLGLSLGEVCQNLNQLETAMRWASTVLDLAIERGADLDYRVKALGLLTDLASTRRDLQEVGRLVAELEELVKGASQVTEPWHFDVMIRKSNLLWEQRRYNDGLKVLKHELEQFTREDHRAYNYRIIFAGMLANGLASLGHFQDALSRYQEVQELLQSVPVTNPIDLAEAQINIAEVLASLGRPGQARREMLTAIHLAEESVGSNSPELIRSLFGLAMLLISLGEFEYATRTLERIEEVCGSIPNPPALCIEVTAGIQAELAWARGDYQEVRLRAEESLKLQEEYYGTGHLNTAGPMLRAAHAHLRLGEMDRARELAEDVRRIYVAAVGEEGHLVAYPLLLLAELDLFRSDWDLSRIGHERAIALLDRELGDRAAPVAEGREGLGRALAGLGGLDRAREELTEALSIYEEVYGPDHHAVGEACGHLAVVLARAGDAAAARELAARSKRVLERALGPNHPKTVECIANLAAFTLLQFESIG